MRKFTLIVTFLVVFASISFSIMAQTLPVTDLSVSQSQSINPVRAGTSFAYTITVSNLGPNAVNSVQLVDTLPSALLHQSNSAGCVQAPQGTLTCNLGFMAAGESRTVNINVFAAADLVHEAGAPLVLLNRVAVTGTGINELNISNNTANLQTELIASADLSVVSMEIVDAPTEMLAGEPVEITIRSVINNAGISVPMDAAFISTASANNEALIEPASYERDELSLDWDEMRSIENVYTVTCYDSSSSFTFTSAVAPLHSNDVDTNLDNNSASVVFTVDCELSVVIDIRPDNEQNTINLRSNGEIQVAIISNPSTGFDATTLDPSTIFLAGAPVSRTGNGSYKTQERDVDGDGMDDLVVHIRTEDMMLSPGDTSATLVGTTEDGLTISATDDVRIVGNDDDDGDSGRGNGNSNGNSNGNGNGRGNGGSGGS